MQFSPAEPRRRNHTTKVAQIPAHSGVYSPKEVWKQAPSFLIKFFGVSTDELYVARWAVGCRKVPTGRKVIPWKFTGRQGSRARSLVKSGATLWKESYGN